MVHKQQSYCISPYLTKKSANFCKKWLKKAISGHFQISGIIFFGFLMQKSLQKVFFTFCPKFVPGMRYLYISHPTKRYLRYMHPRKSNHYEKHCPGTLNARLQLPQTALPSRRELPRRMHRLRGQIDQQRQHRILLRQNCGFF